VLDVPLTARARCTLYRKSCTIYNGSWRYH
jgi:hypothetical protein